MTADDLAKGPPWHNQPRNLFRQALVFVAVFALSFAYSELNRPIESNWRAAVLYLLVSVVMVTPLFCGLWPPRPWGHREGGACLVRYAPGWRYGLPAWFFVVIGGFSMLGFLADPPQIGAGVACAVAAVLITAGFAVAARERFRVTEQGVERVSPWSGRATALPWTEVTGVELSDYHLILRGRIRSIKVPLGLEGSCEFAARALAGLPAAQLDQAPNVRAVLQHRVSILSGWGKGEGATSRAWWPASLLFVVAVGLGFGGAAAWASAGRFEPAIRFPIPPGWHDLSPGVPDAQFRDLPPRLREQARVKDIEAFAVDRPGIPGVEPEQIFMVRLNKGRMDPAVAPGNLAKSFLETFKARGVEARVVRQGLVEIDGARVAEVEVASGGASLMAFALPLRAQHAVVVITCGPAECDRVRREAGAAVRASKGVSESTEGQTRRAVGVLLMFGSLMAVILGIQLGLPIRTPAPAETYLAAVSPEASAPAPLSDPPPGAMRCSAFVTWGVLLGGGVLYLAISLLPRIQPAIQGAPRVVGLGAAGLSVGFFLGALLVPRVAKGRPGASPGSRAMRRHVIASALCSLSLLSSILGYMLTHDGLLLATAGVAVLGFVIAFPSERRMPRLASQD
jgi:hypothetical protein